MLGLGHEFVDRVLLVGLPCGHLGGQVADFVENLLRCEGHLGEASRSLTLRLFTVVGRGHAICDLRLVGVRFKGLGLFGRYLDR